MYQYLVSRSRSYQRVGTVCFGRWPLATLLLAVLLDSGSRGGNGR